MRGAHPTLVHRFPLGIVALSSRQCSSLATYLARSIYVGCWCEAGSGAWNRTSALPGYKETEEDSLPKRQCHRVALSSRQCSSLATYLARSIYDGRWVRSGLWCVEADLGDPRLQGNGRGFTAETAAPPGGTVVSTVFFPGDVPCSFDLRWMLVRSGTGLRGNVPRRSQAARERKRIHCRNGSATGWHCRPDSVLSWRRTLFVRFTMDDGAKRNHLRGNVPRRSQATRKRKKIHCRNGSATGWHCRPDSVLSWRRTLFV